jgi:hypothetical protein
MTSRLNDDTLRITLRGPSESLRDSKIDENALEAEDAIMGQLRAIGEEFKKFAEDLSPLTAIPRSVEEFEDILIEWLLYVEAFSEVNLNIEKKIGKDANGALKQFVNVPDITNLRDEEKVLCARFVKDAIQKDAGTAEVLIRIASIGLLTEVVQDFIKPSDKIDISDLIVYLDAPVALELLGVSGKSAQENTQPIISELQRMGAYVRVYGQSLEEISTALGAVLENPRPTGPTAQALARNEVLREYVVQVAGDPEEFLSKFGITATHRSLDQVPSEAEYFTSENRDEIYSALIFQQNHHAREHDADVTTLLMRQRRGHQNRDLFKSKFLFVTRNGSLAQVVRRRCVDMGLLSGNSTSPVIHRRVLAASMWLRTGLGAEELGIPKRMLLSSCENVLAIRPGVVEAVRRITESLGDEEKVRQIDMLVSQDRSTQMLMDKTLGATSAVTAENFSELFNEMLHPHLEEERARGREQLVEVQSVEKKKQEALKKKILDISNESAELHNAIQNKMKEDHAIVAGLCRRIEIGIRRGRFIRRLIGVVVSILFCAFPLFSPTNWAPYLSLVLGIPLAYLTITGSKLLGIATSSEKAQRVLSFAARMQNLEAKVDRFQIEWDGKRYAVVDAAKIEAINEPRQMLDLS